MNYRGKSILVCDDDRMFRSEMKKELEASGFQVLEATNGQEAKDIFLTYNPCFVILEVYMKDLDGFEWCDWIRTEQKSEIPMILVSKLPDESNTIKGLKSGADDFLLKPFNLKELTVRVETVLRRTAHRCNKITYRGITLKPLKGEVKVEGEGISLTLHEFKLLYFLMRHPNQALSRLQILDELYPNDQKLVSERTVDVHILKLREKFKSYIDGEWIETIRGVGYRFVAF
ncbi:response regulator transcription factor [Bacillus sp. 31A1R]|uniref:Response regulator transcription factor n=1 Tax=Robertmurraya mangrovi TaxID=3098077 RepID=A0ABU5IYS7_9BACI|nr:response regulator transcription factor [Bacillus sp. 31A1R]MDZ5472272.1 response regulator transcription factor [Bacillus sp. 31A1R]